MQVEWLRVIRHDLSILLDIFMTLPIAPSFMQLISWQSITENVYLRINKIAAPNTLKLEKYKSSWIKIKTSLSRFFSCLQPRPFRRPLDPYDSTLKVSMFTLIEIIERTDVVFLVFQKAKRPTICTYNAHIKSKLTDAQHCSAIWTTTLLRY